MFGSLLKPNNSTFPSAPQNDTNSLMDVVHFSGSPEMAAIGPEFDPLYENYAPQGPQNALMAMREKFPFLPILPLPNSVVAFALVANQVQEVQIPTGMAMAMISGDAAYWVSLQGNAQLPAIGVNPLDANQSRSFYRPDGIFFFIAGKSALSFISGVTSNVSIALWAMNELPANV